MVDGVKEKVWREKRGKAIKYVGSWETGGKEALLPSPPHYQPSTTPQSTSSTHRQHAHLVGRPMILHGGARPPKRCGVGGAIILTSLDEDLHVGDV